MREWFSRLDARYGNSGFWQFLKFNVVGWSVCLLQLILANVLPFLFDSQHGCGSFFLQKPCLTVHPHT